jgi:hypothetical protein
MHTEYGVFDTLVCWIFFNGNGSCADDFTSVMTSCVFFKPSFVLIYLIKQYDITFMHQIYIYCGQTKKK